MSEWQARQRRAFAIYNALPSEDERHALDERARRTATVERGEPAIDPHSWAHDRMACEFARARERAWISEVDKLGISPPPDFHGAEAAPETHEQLTSWAASLPEIHKPAPSPPRAPDPWAFDDPPIRVLPPLESTSPKDPWAAMGFESEGGP